MNWTHLRAFVWLRWRLFVNQMRRGGAVNAVFLAIFLAGAFFLSAVLAAAGFLAGLLLAPAPPAVVLYVWDGVVVAFLFSWTLGLLVELQRSEALSLGKFLHLPVSLTGVFLINYLSSTANLTLIVFLPAAVALTLGLAVGRGPLMLLTLPPLAAFFLMTTALTYQFQGWLASLLSNPRRRRTVVVLLTMAFVLSCQAPNLFNILFFVRERPGSADPGAPLRAELEKLSRSFQAGEIAFPEYQRRQQDILHEFEEKRREQDSRELEQVGQAASVLNAALPPGWLPLGAEGAADGNPLPALLGCVGMTLIGSASLWRSYRTTLRLYTGQAGGKRPAAAPTPAPRKPAGNPLERRLPWLSEPASAVALASFRSLLRAPEAKMMLLTPVILLLVFGALFFAQSITIPEVARPLLPYAAMVLILFTMVQLVGNQFGFDRGGFRVYVLGAAPRRDILLGKNLAVAPIALALAAPMVVLAEVVAPTRLDYLLAVAPQAATMYLSFCVLANWMSILVPLPIRAGSFKPATTKAAPLLLQMAFALLAPTTFLPALVPYAVDIAVAEGAGFRGLPVCLALSIVECAAAVYLYRLLLTGQGALLQSRERRILEAVTTKEE